MTKVLVLYYSAYGHIEKMANAVAEGAREAGASVDIKRVPELVPEAVAKASHYKLDQPAPVAKIEDLANYDAVIVGTGTRFGRMASQMANFLDQAGGLWIKGALHGKVGGAFTSTATQHGGQETTLFSIITNLLHFGMTIIGLNYGFAGQMELNDVTGGSPYGATTITGGDGSRQPSDNELAGARYQGRVIAETAKKLHGPPGFSCRQERRTLVQIQHRPVCERAHSRLAATRRRACKGRTGTLERDRRHRLAREKIDTAAAPEHDGDPFIEVELSTLEPRT
jgi:NAD(P)H dehydrogenase (quinone)